MSDVTLEQLINNAARGASTPTNIGALLAAQMPGQTGSMTSHQSGLRELIGDYIYDAATKAGMGKSAQGMRENAQTAADFVPGLGDAIGAQEAGQQLGMGNYGAGAAGLQSVSELRPPTIGKLPKLALRPFQPGESVTNKDGSYSTERTVTLQAPDGGWVNVPSLWMGPNGPVDLRQMPHAEDAISKLLGLYEMENGPSFQRFRSVDEAVSTAKKRSDAGGAGSGMNR